MPSQKQHQGHIKAINHIQQSIKIKEKLCHFYNSTVMRIANKTKMDRKKKEVKKGEGS